MKRIFTAMLLVIGLGQFAQASQWYGESAYFRCNDDVREAYNRGEIRSGYDHYINDGRYENRITDGRCYASDAPSWFSERAYLRCNRDVAQAVRYGDYKSGYHHYRMHGQSEGRDPQCRQ